MTLPTGLDAARDRRILADAPSTLWVPRDDRRCCGARTSLFDYDLIRGSASNGEKSGGGEARGGDQGGPVHRKRPVNRIKRRQARSGCSRT